MARIWQCGWELNSIAAGVELSTTSGTASVQSTTVRTGGFAGRTNPAAATGFFRYHAFAANQSSIGYQRVYLRIATLPAANTTVMRFLDIANATCAQIRLTATGTLVLLDAAGTAVGSASAALSTGTWYRVELKCDASTSPGSVDARIDGVSFASGVNNIQSPWARVIVGPVITATCDLFWDDWALNDASGSTQTSWPGDGKILHLVPTGDGDNHAWSNTANAAGSATNWQLVDEVPPNDATDLVQTGTLNTEDMYALTDSGIGASDTVNVVMVGARLRNNVADAATAAKVQVKKTSAGTIAQGTDIIPNSTTWATNAPAEPRNYTLITTADPNSAAWTQATLDSMQAGAKLTVAGTNRIQVTALWVSADYTPSSSTPVSSSDTASGAESATLAAAASSSDAGVASEAGTLDAATTAADTAIAIEAASLATAAGDADAGGSAEAASVAAAITYADTAIATDQVTGLGAAISDTAGSSDTAIVAVSIAGGDAATAVESATADTGGGSVPLSAADTVGAIETAAVVVEITAADVAGVVESATLITHLAAIDTVTAADAGILTATLLDTQATQVTEAAYAATDATTPGTIRPRAATGAAMSDRTSTVAVLRARTAPAATIRGTS